VYIYKKKKEYADLSYEWENELPCFYL